MSTDTDTDTDILIVGGGTGGATLAGLLIAHGHANVTLLESGPDYGALDDGRWPEDLLDPRYIPLSHDWGLVTGVGSSQTPLDLPRARVIGGCSSHNGCTAAVGSREDYDEWERMGAAGWGADAMVPLLEMVRTRFRIQRYQMDELTPAQAAFVAAGQAIGLPFADDLDSIEAATGIGPMPVNIVDRRRYNSAFAFLDPVRERNRLWILDRALVDRLVIEDGAVVGVTGHRDGDPFTVRATSVVLCAGAYGSPGILLRSGIGPAADAERLGIDVTVDLPGVGCGLLDHPCTPMGFRGSEAFLNSLNDDGWRPDEQSVARARSSVCDDGPYDIHVFLVAGANTGHPDLPPISLYGGAMKARSHGRVTLADRDPRSAPVINHRYLSDPDDHDRTVLADARELMTQITSVPTFAQWLGDPADDGASLVDSVVNYCHPAGGCRLGARDNPLAVTNSEGAVHGVDGLRIADASLMPTITRGNINLPVAAVAARVAASILGLSSAELAARASPGSAPAQLTREIG
jgi:choline dehydrogenase